MFERSTQIAKLCVWKNINHHCVIEFFFLDSVDTACSKFNGMEINAYMESINTNTKVWWTWKNYEFTFKAEQFQYLINCFYLNFNFGHSFDLLFCVYNSKSKQKYTQWHFVQMRCGQSLWHLQFYTHTPSNKSMMLTYCLGSGTWALIHGKMSLTTPLFWL